jgi:RNA ligase
MRVRELINPDLMRKMYEGGYIRIQSHPSLPLSLYNYTEKAQFQRMWNTATLNSRGLIVDDESEEIVARPFPKFFNWGERMPKGGKFKMSMDEPIIATDKIDGSLGILYPRGDRFGHTFATRGSFTSDQARHANMIWLEKYHRDWEYLINDDYTMLFEIVYPENRIVVNYGDLDDIVLLGAVHIETGRVLGPEMFPAWPGPKAKVLEPKTLAQAVEAKPRPGKEGIVVRSLSDGLMLKIKQEDYVSLHRVVTGLNEKEIWRRLSKAHCDADELRFSKIMDQVLQDIPDELHEWVNKVVEQLWADFVLMSSRLMCWFQEVPLTSRKDLGLWIKSQEDCPKWLASGLWLLYDGKDTRELIWKQLEPRGDVKK